MQLITTLHPFSPFHAFSCCFDHKVYPPISFVAELGGSLGLCLGVSLLSSWDLVDYLLRTVHIKSYLK